MSDNDNSETTRQGALTRRDTLTYGTTLAVGGLVAGCTGDGGADSASDSAPQDIESESTPTPEDTETGGSEESTEEDSSYSVTMAPMGTVTFDSVPESAAVYDDIWADMMIALGQQDGVVSLGWPDRYYHGFYDQLPGVSFDSSGLPGMWSDGLDKEQFYELDPDVFHLDPCRFTSFDSGMDSADFEEIRENVAPFFANRFSRAHSDPPEGQCRENYQYYTVWELTAKMSQVYQVENRGNALRSIRDEMVSEINDRLPPEEERPTVALVIFNQKEETFGLYELNGPGFAKAHYRPLGAKGAFAGSDKTYANDYSDIDLEQMLEVDPDVIIHHWDIEPSERFEALLALEDHPVGKELTAIKNDRVYVGGTPMQGPIYNLFQLENAAQQIYPEEFGEFQGATDTPDENKLFDRQRVADIINGEF